MIFFKTNISKLLVIIKNMKLLEAEKVKEENKQSTQNRIQRIAKLNDEENATVKRINQLHDNEKKEKENVVNGLIEIKKSAKAEKQKIVDEISTLKNEVKLLEKRKVEALKPIKDIQTQAENALKRAKSTLTALESRKTELDAFHEKNIDLAEELADQENDIMQRNTESEKKYNLAILEEKRQKESTEKLSKDWVEYHKTINNANKEISRREKEVETGSRANENFKITLDKKEKEQAEHDRQIADRYGTLGRAIEEAKRNYGVNL